MYFLLIQLSFILFYEKVFAEIYNSPCTTKCNFPGMVCVSGRCKCDSKAHLFWTNARCLSCPNEWAMSDTKCIVYYGTKMNWNDAVSTCQNMQGDLLSLRDNSILPLLYQVTDIHHRRKKRTDVATDPTVGWTSAHALDLTNFGLYGWNDKSLGTFDSRHTWWCKMNIPDLGYYYPYQDPTRWTYENQVEERCILYRRGISSIPMLCLDDIACHLEYPFICERSESTAQKFLGPPSMNDGDTHDNSGTKPGPGTTTTTSSSHPNGTGGNNESINPNANHAHGSGMFVAPHAAKSKKNKKTIIIIIVIGLLLLIGVLAGVFFFIKRRNSTATRFSVGGHDNKENPTAQNERRAVKNNPAISDMSDVDEPATQRTSAGETGLTLDAGANPGNLNINIGNQKQQKNKKGGYSKQQFDEFE